MEPTPLLSHQEPVDNFPREQRQEHRRFGGGIQEPGEPHHGVQQVHIHMLTGSMPHPVGQGERDALRPRCFCLGGHHLTDLPAQSPQ